MDPDEFTDPYCWPGTNTLINKAGIRDKDKLSRRERVLTWVGRMELNNQPPPDTLDGSTVRFVHHTLFSRIYDWAGKFRTVDIAKGESTFVPASYIAKAFTYLEAEMKMRGLGQSNLSDDDFIQHGAWLLSELNYIHPFREGNGRTQRAFLDLVATASGRELCWRNISKEVSLRASIETFKTGKPDAFVPIFTEIIKPPTDGREILSQEAYEVDTVASAASVVRGSIWVRPHVRNGKCVAGHWRMRPQP